MLPRFVRVLLIAVCACSGFVLFNIPLAELSALQPPSREEPTLTATTKVKPTDWFSATAVVTNSAPAAIVGELLTVTARLITTGTCGLSLYDVTLRQSESLFTHLDPADNVIGPPGANPAVWQLRAQQTGVTTFSVEFYGETYCDGVWAWTSIRRAAQPISVTGTVQFLPYLGRSAQPLHSMDLERQ